MTSIVNEWFRKQERVANYGRDDNFHMIGGMNCEDGFQMSVQASYYHYCEPRVTGASFYEQFEIGYPSEKEYILMEYADDPTQPTGTIYGYVPFEIIDKVIIKHGGIKGG